ncbi:methyltransferase family protein [Mycolicibacterium rhodesiae]|uniref:methyltransferase family protein n=1 Tax=Mycolicibacterium rhodesiae TaxID=36814 RepID=UPI001F2D1BEB|nr:isoprenylcysteine carboxylmethyltransferase family protein [Mycolicibacterium rhodesiae]
MSYGVVCHALFAVAVGSMVVAMYFGMSRSFGRVPAPWSWVANAALLIQFPVVHSLLLTARGRTVLARLAPRGTGATLAPTTYVIVGSLQLIGLFALWTPSGTMWWQADGSALIVMVALYVFAWVLLGKSMLDAGLSLQTGSLGWVALLRGRKLVFPKMPTTGLFRLSRQPIYVAFALTVWTVPTWTPDQLVLALVFTTYCLVGPLLKEARFRRVFGAEFDNYARGVPYWLPLPGRLRGRSGRRCEPPAGRIRISRRQG